MLIPPLPPLCVRVTSAFRSLPVSRDPSTPQIIRHSLVAHGIVMQQHIWISKPFREITLSAHRSPARTPAPGSKWDVMFFSCGIFYFFIKQTSSSDAGDNAISSSFVRLGVCSRFVKLSEEMVNCLREMMIKIVHQVQDLTLSLSTSEELS